MLPQVYLFGGAVCSWKQASGDEVLYVRPDAVFDKSKPISGGAACGCAFECFVNAR
jgi:glucose-6-phosphate 1-epimerase